MNIKYEVLNIRRHGEILQGRGCKILDGFGERKFEHARFRRRWNIRYAEFWTLRPVNFELGAAPVGLARNSIYVPRFLNIFDVVLQFPRNIPSWQFPSTL